MTEPEQRRRGLDAAVSAMQRGQLVVAPLDTAYGLLADAFSGTGIAALRVAKGRPDLAIPVLVARVRAVSGIAVVGPDAHDLMTAFWPGPLTLVLRAQPSLAWDLADAAGRIAVRMPLHPVALELLERTGPVAAVTAPGGDDAAAAEALSASVHLAAGPLPPSAASTVVDLTGRVPRLVRAGAAAVDQIRLVCPALDAPGEAPSGP